MSAPHGIDEIKAVYGDIVVARVDGSRRIISPPYWEERHCIIARSLPGYDRPIYVNRAIEEPLKAALLKAQQSCPDYKIRTMGCFNPRPKRIDGSALSLHSWAVAVDINADTNPMKDPLTCDMPPEFIDAFVSNGWTWGGTFPTPDPMHFQLASGY